MLQQSPMGPSLLESPLEHFGLSQPCVRGGLTLTHATIVFMDTVAGVADKLTDNPLYEVGKKEPLSTALPGRTPRQALTLSGGSPCSFGRLGCRPHEFDLSEDPQLVPVASVRYPDVRGPSGFTTRRCWYPERLLAKLTRSKTIGADRDLKFRLVVVDAASSVQEPTCLVAGWDLLCKAAPYERDHL